MLAVAESQGQCELSVADVNFSHYGDIAVFSAVEFPIHFEVVVQILPAVAGADKAAGTSSKSAIAPDRHVSIVLPCQQNLAPGNLHLSRRIAKPAHLKMRRHEKIQLQFSAPLRAHSKFDVYQHATLMRIGDNFRGQGVTSFRIFAGCAEAQRLRLQPNYRGGKVAFLLMEKGFVVGDEELSVPDLRAVNGGIVNFSQDSTRQAEPHAARGGVRRPHTLFGTG